MIQEVHYGILAVHLIVGFALVYLAMKAFKKTKYPPRKNRKVLHLLLLGCFQPDYLLAQVA